MKKIGIPEDLSEETINKVIKKVEKEFKEKSSYLEEECIAMIEKENPDLWGDLQITEKEQGIFGSMTLYNFLIFYYALSEEAKKQNMILPRISKEVFEADRERGGINPEVIQGEIIAPGMIKIDLERQNLGDLFLGKIAKKPLPEGVKKLLQGIKEFYPSWYSLDSLKFNFRLLLKFLYWQEEANRLKDEVE